MVGDGGARGIVPTENTLGPVIEHGFFYDSSLGAMAVPAAASSSERR